MCDIEFEFNTQSIFVNATSLEGSHVYKRSLRNSSYVTPDKYPILDFTFDFTKLYYEDEFIKIGADNENNLTTESLKRSSVQLLRNAANRNIRVSTIYGIDKIDGTGKRYFNLDKIEPAGTFDGTTDKVKVKIYDYKSRARREFVFTIPKIIN